MSGVVTSIDELNDVIKNTLEEYDEHIVNELKKNTKKAMKGIGRRGMGGGAMNRIMGQFMK